MILWLLLQVILWLLLEMILVLIKKNQPFRNWRLLKNAYGAQLAFFPFKEGARAVLQPRRQVHCFKKKSIWGLFLVRISSARVKVASVGCACSRTAAFSDAAVVFRVVFLCVRLYACACGCLVPVNLQTRSPVCVCAFVSLGTCVCARAVCASACASHN